MAVRNLMTEIGCIEENFDHSDSGEIFDLGIVLEQEIGDQAVKQQEIGDQAAKQQAKQEPEHVRKKKRTARQKRTRIAKQK